MRISVEMNDETVRKAASIVMKHFGDEEFIKRLKNVEQYNHTAYSSSQIGVILPLEMSERYVLIKGYKSFSPWSKAIGYSENHTIFVNTRKLGLPLIDRVENVFHEMCHEVGFQHKGNYVTAYNLKTVPYLASAIFAKYVSEIYGD